MVKISKILYPTDFSEHSQAALPLAIDLANRYDAQLHCLHVVDVTRELSMQGGYFVPLMIEHPVDKEQLRRLAREHLNEFVLENMSELRSSVPKAVVLGEPFEEIIRYANQEKVDLIVIGTHGRTALASILLGSVAEKVISRAPCAVLSVRHPEYKFKES